MKKERRGLVCWDCGQLVCDSCGVNEPHTGPFDNRITSKVSCVSYNMRVI